MGQNVQTKTHHVSEPRMGTLAAWLAVPSHRPVVKEAAKTYPKPDTAAAQRTAPSLPGFLTWFVDGMKMEARAGRWY